MLYRLKPTDRLVPAMAYTDMCLIWGKIIAPEAVRVPTWLKVSLVPSHFSFVEVNMLTFGGSQPIRSTFPEMHLPTDSILAFHVLPPTEVEPDYDPEQKNMEMRKVTALANIYRFDGFRRISILGDTVAAIQSLSQTFSPLYDVTVSHPLAPAIKDLTVPYVLLRSAETKYVIHP